MAGIAATSTEGYLVEIPYVRQFYGEISPARLRAAVAVNGFAPPPAGDFDMCEIGCGQGDTLAALAAANPDARFVGVDLSAEHVAAGRALARSGGLENVAFLARDVASLASSEDVGEFDYVVAHGFWTWVGEPARRALVDFAQARLRPGGVLYVSYNALPGWAAVEPLRQLLASADPSAPVAERAARGLELARRLERAGARYFVENPAAREMLDLAEREGIRYVVHEYLQPSWEPMHHARVAWTMREAGLSFVGVLPLADNYRDLALTEAEERALGDVSDRHELESLKDYVTNAFFRREIYAKAPTRRAAEAWLDETPFGFPTVHPGEPSARVGARTLDLGSPAHRAVVARLRRGAASGAAVAGDPEVAPHGAPAAREALRELLVAERIAPMRTETRAAEGPAAGPPRLLSAFDRAMLRRRPAEGPILLASTVAGTAFPLSPADATALEAATRAPRPDAIDAAGWAVLRKLEELGIVGFAEAW